MRISVKVKTRASKNALEKNPDGSYTAFLTAAPVEGKANKALVGILADEFGVAKSRMEIVKGAHSKNKVVEISGAKGER